MSSSPHPAGHEVTSAPPALPGPASAADSLHATASAAGSAVSGSIGSAGINSSEVESAGVSAHDLLAGPQTAQPPKRRTRATNRTASDAACRTTTTKSAAVRPKLVKGTAESAGRGAEQLETSEPRSDDFDRLFGEWSQTGDPRLRERLILMNRNLVSYIARKFLDRGEMSEDIMQQGLIGLINALDHFDPTRGVRFATFATPTIMGEIRRYFRDKTWGIRVPRRLQELNQTINTKIEDLTQEFDRSPTYAEIAHSLHLRVEEVVEALEMVYAMEPLSMEEEVRTGQNGEVSLVGDQIGAADPDLESWGDHAVLQAALEKLPETERRVLEMAYFQEHSQVEIARHMKVSQMFVSRLQRRALSHLRELMNSHEV